MRKLFLPLLLISCLLLTACAARQTPPSPLQLAQEFTVNADILCGNASMKAALHRAADHSLTADFTDPPAIRPLTVRLAQGACSLQYNTLTVGASPERTPQTLATFLVADTWDVITQRTDLTRNLTDGIWTVNGSGASGAFVFTCDAATGAPLALSIENASLHVRFEQYQPITNG